MKRWTRAVFHNWRIKLACLAAATLIWLFIKHSIREDAAAPSPPAAVAPMPPLP